MFFVYKELLSKIEVIGGTVSPKSAQILAEKRAKQKLEWVETEDGYESEIEVGKVKVTYRIRCQER